MSVRAPWFQRRPYLFLTVLFTGLGVASGVLIEFVHVPSQAVFALVMVGCVVVLPRVLRRSARRPLGEYASDPNVVWAASVRLDKLDVLEVGLDPAPPQDQSTVVLLLTRTGVSLQPFEGTAQWPGLDIPAARIGAVSRGRASVGNRTSPALRLLIDAAVITLPILSGADGLDEALQQPPLAGVVCTPEEFVERWTDADVRAVYGEETDEVDPFDATCVEEKAPAFDYKRTFWKKFALYVGAEMGAVVLGVALAIIGNTHHWPVLTAAGIILVLGAIVTLGILNIRNDITAGRDRKRRIAERTAELETQRRSAQ